ncbi:MAG: pyrimidine 5'-nucleotidase [Mariprofundaceae bacterium]
MPFDLAIIDLDNTLYSAGNGVFERMDCRMNQFVGHALGVDVDEANDIRERYWLTYGTTLKGMMLHHGTDPETFLEDVHDIDVHEVLGTDVILDHALSAMPCRKVIHTNGTREHALRVLQSLDIAHHFSEIYDIRFNHYEPKPDKVTLTMLLAKENMSPQRSVVIDDRAENLAIARELGLKTAWVTMGSEKGVWHYQAKSFQELLPQFVTHEGVE